MSFRVCLDFDGVLHKITRPYKNAYTIDGDAIHGAREALNGYLEDGAMVFIFSCRSKDPQGRAMMEHWIDNVLLKGLPKRYIEYPMDKPVADVYVDDLAYRFTGRWPDLKELGEL
jgi:hypothetical protein